MKRSTQCPTFDPSAPVQPTGTMDASSAPASPAFTRQKPPCWHQVVDLLRLYQDCGAYLHPTIIAELLGLNLASVSQACRVMADAGFIRRKQLTHIFERAGTITRRSSPHYYLDESCRPLRGQIRPGGV